MPTMSDPEVSARKAALAQELEAEIRKYFGFAKSAYLWLQGLFILSLCCSALAAILGLFLGVPGKIVGGIAALPPIIAFVAVNLKLQARSNWHYRKSYALDALRSRLLYQLPANPTVDDIAAIAKARDDNNDAMEREWQGTMETSFADMLKQRPMPHSIESPPNQGLAQPRH